MRARYVFALLLVFAVFSLTGQEEPLPTITPVATIQLPDEPILESHAPTLASAAHANDFATFDAMYSDARRRGDSVRAYAMLHELWQYSIHDPIGAFYGKAMHDRLARLYPDYATFIEDHSIVDDNGNVFYPTSETRAFLLAKAEAGVIVTPREEPVRVARAVERPHPVKHVIAVPPPAPVQVVHIAPPVVITPAPAPARVAVAAKPAPIVASVVVPQQAPIAPARKADRGLLLVIVGLAGIGLLALILRTPREEFPTITPPQNP